MKYPARPTVVAQSTFDQRSCRRPRGRTCATARGVRRVWHEALLLLLTNDEPLLTASSYRRPAGDPDYEPQGDS
jgi:hypothetical protein